jgi:hypothetical protein
LHEKPWSREIAKSNDLAEDKGYEISFFRIKKELVIK